MSVNNSATLLYHHHQHQHHQQHQQQQQHHSVASTPTNGTLSQSHHYQHHHQQQQQPQQPQQQQQDDRQQVGGGGGGGAGRRSSSRGQQAPPPTAGDADAADAAAAAVTSDGHATPPPPPPADAAMDGNDGEDGRREENGRREEDGKREEYHGPRLLPLTTTQEVVTYLDDNEDFTTETELLIDRDPFRWHEGIVKVKFDDIFGEPDSEIFSFDSVWKLSSKVYKTTKLWCYRLLSVVFVVPLVVVWGVVFSCLSFSRIWVCVPLLKAADIQLHCLRRLIEALLRTFLAPCFEAVGRCLYHIRLRIIRGDESSL